MSAAPRFNAAPGRLRLRRVAFARLARIREEQEEPYPDLSKLNPRSANEIEKLLLLAALLERCGIDPVPELHRVLDKRMKSALKAERRLAALLEAEEERRRERDEPGLSTKERALRAARHPMNEAHRKRLRLARAAIVRLQLVRNACERVVAAPLPKSK